MKNQFLTIVSISFVLVFLHSCSVVKTPLASTNFKRVKYNSHLNLSTSKSESKETARAEKRLPKTVQSFSKEKIIPKVPAGYSSIAKNVSDNSLFKEEFEIESAEKSIKRKGLLKNISEIEVTENLVNKNAVLLQQNDYWWEDDIEDWPWLEIALAIIAVLVIAIVVTILVSLIGGLVSSLFGLILLIALAYILYTLWF